MSRFLAIDWGTTNRRVYVIDGGVVELTERDALGILAVPEGGFPPLIAELRQKFGDLPMVLAGMVGSNRGWVDAGYVPAPADLASLAANVIRPAPGVAVVPGVSRVVGGRGDVMRGEEVQLLGAAGAGLTPDDALLCQPGTHCKWARLQGGLLADFATAMTGEMFSLLKTHALIGREMTEPPADDAAFADGVAESAEGDLLAALFSVRPSSLLGLQPAGRASSFVSGLLIGSDVRAHAAPGEEVYLLADPVLGGLYARALDCIGAVPRRVDSHAAFVAGVTQIQERLT